MCVIEDRSFHNTGYRRKIYISEGEVGFRIPEWPHQHKGRDHLLLISGQAWFAYKTNNSKIKYIKLKIGTEYSTPPNVIHQSKLVNGIIEVISSYTPSGEKVRYFLNEKFF